MTVGLVASSVDRDEARELARRELAKPSYERDTPIVSRVVEWVVEQIDRILDGIGRVLSGNVAAAVVVTLVAVLAATIIVRAGRTARRAARRSAPMFGSQRLTAAEYAATADRAAARSEWNTAVVERYRAVVAALEELGVLGALAGRTADEAAAEAGAVRADIAEPLRSAALLFDAVRYGGVDAVAADDAAMRDLHTAVQRTSASR